VEMFPASLRLRQKTRVLQQNVKIYSLVFSILACARQPQKKSYGRLSGNNRPITDYLKNGRLNGFADYLPINWLIPNVCADGLNQSQTQSSTVYNIFYCI
jgi:hypothetical protein